MQIPGAVSVLMSRALADYVGSKAVFHVAPPPPFERASNIRDQALSEAKSLGEKMTPALLSRITSKLYREDRKAELRGLYHKRKFMIFSCGSMGNLGKAHLNSS